MWLQGTVHSTSILETIPLYISSHAWRGCVEQIEVVRTMIDWMKTTLEEAQANLTIAQSRAKSHVDRSRHDETFEVGNEVALSTHNIRVNQHLPSKLR